MTERRLAEITDYDGMIAALRARMTEIGVTNETMDALTGLQSGYVGKLLAPRRIKYLGTQSMGLMLQTLGLKLIVVEDPETTAKMQERWDKREKAAPIRAMASIPRATWLFTSRSGRRAAKARAEKLSPAELSKIGRKGMRVRWKEERRKRRLKRKASRARDTSQAVLPPLLEPPTRRSQSAGIGEAITPKPRQFVDSTA